MTNRVLRTFARIAVACALLAPVSLTAKADVPVVVDVKDISIQVGATSAARSFTWLSRGDVDQTVRVYLGLGKPYHVVAARHVERGAAATDPGWFYHHATIDSLFPATEYSYQVGSDSTGWSAPVTFHTNTNSAFHFLVMGDPQIYVGKAGGGNPAAGWASTLATATTNIPHSAFMLTVGDQVDTTKAAKQGPEWDAFFAPPQLRSLSLATTNGNHDDAKGTGTGYGEHTAMPNQSGVCATINGSSDYWFEYNGTMMLNINSNCLDVAAHEKFLTETITAHPDMNWRMLAFHHAPFSAADHPMDPNVVLLREKLAPIISRLGINLVLNGHDHDYARSYLMNGATPVAGSGTWQLSPKPGEVLYVATNSASGGKHYPLTGPYPWAAVVNQENVPNYTNVQVSAGALIVTTYRATDNSVVDKVVLRRR